MGSGSPGSKERRVEPQMTVARTGFPLQVHAFDGNTAETKTTVPVVQASPPRTGCLRSPWSLMRE